MNTKTLCVATTTVFVLAACNCLPPTTPDLEPPAQAEPPSNLDELGAQIDALPVGTHVSMLFALKVSRASATQAEDGSQSTLTFDVEDVTEAIGFTDRPQRYAFNITMPALASGWSEGTNSFESDPPNAVVESARSRMGVTEITSFGVDGSVVTVGLNRMAFRSVDTSILANTDVEDLCLFIDSGWLKVTGGSIAFGLQQAAKACVSVDCELWPLGA